MVFRIRNTYSVFSDLRSISKDPEFGPPVLLLGTDHEKEAKEDDPTTEKPKKEEKKEPEKNEIPELPAYNYEEAEYDYELADNYQDYLFTTDYFDREQVKINDIIVDDTKWVWKTPGVEDDADIIHGGARNLTKAQSRSKLET